MKTVLTIAGSDPSGGAGIQADLQTFLAFGVRGLTAITALTAQDETRFLSLNPVSSKILQEQLKAVSKIKIDAIKIGMLGTRENVVVVAHFLKRMKGVKVVLDPVFRSSTGAVLLDLDGISLLKDLLIPLATVVTPNLDEAEILTGMKVRSLEEMKEAAQTLYRSCRGVKAVLIKGGHLKGAPTDLLFDGRHHHLFPAKRWPGPSPHGTGCVLSSAIAANLALGVSLNESVEQAKRHLFQKFPA